MAKRVWVKVLTSDEKVAAMTLDRALAEDGRMVPPV